MSSSSPAPTPPAAPSATGSPSSSSSQSDSDTATLYLFTFLATILILVLLSVSLIFRSWILRRRYRQRFQRALADGLFPDFDRGPAQFDPLGRLRRSARPLPPSPVLWDTWTHTADKSDTLLTITVGPSATGSYPFLKHSLQPVAVQCVSVLASTPPLSPPSLQARSRSSIFSQFRLPSPFSLSPSPLRSRALLSTTLPTSASTRPSGPVSSGPSSEGDSVEILTICVLIAMPSLSIPAHRPGPDIKGKSTNPLDFQAHQSGGDADPLLQSALHQPGARTPDLFLNEERLPLLEFGVLELKRMRM